MRGHCPPCSDASYATLLYSAGMGLKAVQQKTGHASADTLLRHYVADDAAAKPLLDRTLRGGLGLVSKGAT